MRILCKNVQTLIFNSLTASNIPHFYRFIAYIWGINWWVDYTWNSVCRSAFNNQKHYFNGPEIHSFEHTNIKHRIISEEMNDLVVGYVVRVNEDSVPWESVADLRMPWHCCQNSEAPFGIPKTTTARYDLQRQQGWRHWRKTGRSWISLNTVSKHSLVRAWNKAE
jgi:hypothetical protein